MSVALHPSPAARRWIDPAVVDADDLPGRCWPLHRVSHLVDHLLWMQLQGRTDRTLLARRRAMVMLAEHLDDDPATAPYEALYAWQLLMRKKSLQHVAWHTALVRPYYRWLHLTGKRTDNPAALLPTPRQAPRLPRPISETELRTAITQAPARLLAWLLLAGWSGMRASEIAGLRVEDIAGDAAGHVWWRVHGKGGKWRDVPVPGWAWPAIAADLPTSGPAWRLERSSSQVSGKHVSNYCNRYLRLCGIADTLHAFRHRVGTVTYAQTGDIRLVQDLLGHADIATTALYTKVASPRVAAAVAELPEVELPRHRRHLHAVPHARGAAR